MRIRKGIIIFRVIVILIIVVVFFTLATIKCGENPSTSSISSAELDKIIANMDVVEISNLYKSGRLNEDELNRIQISIGKELDAKYIALTEGKITKDDFDVFAGRAALIAPIKSKVLALSDKSTQFENYKSIYNDALNFVNEGNLLDAYDLKQTIPDDVLFKLEGSNGVLTNLKPKLLIKYIPKARSLISSGKFDEALIIADRLINYFPDNTDVKNIVFSSTDIVPFDGIVQHIFFHPLIAYPERAFNGPDAKGQDDYMTTVTEFKEALKQLYANDYVLIDAKSMFDAPLTRNGAVISLTKKPVMVPKNKKPIIISVDDISYYDYMKTDGEVFKLVLDNNGDVATYSKDMKGNDVISKDNEIIPILDEFVKEHPDFSMNGVKGMLCLTTFDGILGYASGPPNDPQYAEGNKEVQPIVNRLKNTGWYFASHGDGHFHSLKISDSLFERDIDYWLSSTEHLIGYTPLFVYPYGEEVPLGSVKFNYAQSKGFAMFFSVGSPMFVQYGPSYLRQSRRDVDGIAMKDRRLYDLFDVPKLVDPVRPWYQEYKLNVWPKQ